MEADPDPDNMILQFVLIAVLTLVNAFFSAAEMSIVSLNKTRMKILSEEGNRNAQILEKLIKEPTKFLSTVQVGITLASFFSSAFAATGLSDMFGGYLKKINIPYSSQVALIVVTIVLSYFTLVFGELFPKRIALQKSEKIAMLAARPILYVSKITVPFVKLLSASTNVLLRITGMNMNKLEEKVSIEEIKSIVEAGQEYGVINESEKEMIDSIFEFDDRIAEEVMTPRTEVYLINIDTPLNKYVDELLEIKYSRVPVFEGDSDNIIGILYIKDFIVEARKVGFENVNIKNIIHSPYFVPERKNINELFKELQAAKKHMAVLIDEYGGFSGIVTIEDLIEEVMGNISDEYDEDDNYIKKIDESTFIIKGIIPIRELNEQLDLDLDEETDDYDTLGGLLIKLIGHIPEDNEQQSIKYKGITFEIKEVKEKRIEKVEVHLQKDLLE
ncbi:putative hemolysin [Clostridium acetobutylicum]|uniref:CBS-domain containing protein, YHDP B.subtilis ortholog n=1 Tax=Clostridium acetobutylicum (strain ATCC 824 / DSM 792 / JCM 1419 / IAM 19013 / LMG 5710 / NBRC 13948 / NRRL B-527 / VKM B-1787 / 2291 / W) TaxID=272562 RepID=Q97LU4_CLOAB|nr:MULTISPECIES: hemolysin family protein [Clostridium]AAK78440.1 CBS-domain containing protein, YHDP B.subtilis ortholog [Clostridium acetobutylicum ATCC 824]ADZ19510.1 CBS-domain containing protein [Clostridium acetobutylicum EA 2018]AEI33537.1 CBS-domain containing protein [Clostridium acetobutylicum DSM 1731]AWV80162.1 HlyC/CorC family transporter [Clostridium acetobutylicum]MBC2392343.1 HlyC/CorC family transporter [Clostridium acetobutylicum]